MKAPVLVTIIVGLHVGAIGLFGLTQGCQTQKPVVEEPPPPPVMPPRTTQVPPVAPVRPPLPPPPMPEIGTYTVRRGDSLTVVAQRLGVSWRELAELNALKDPYVIREGQALLVPGYSGEIEPPPRPAAPSAEAAPRPAGPGMDYVVQSGDTLTGLAQRFGVRWREIAAANSLQDPYRIRVGQTLRIPGATEPRPAAPQAVPPPRPEPAAPAAAVTVPPPAEAPPAPRMGESEPFPYRVVEGDTPESIAHMFLVSVGELMRMNNLRDASDLRVGQTIRIPQPSTD